MRRADVNTVLVPVDFSDATAAVVRAACGLCRAVKGSIWLLHVAAPEPAFVGYDPGPPSVRQNVAQKLRAKHQRLDRLQAELVADGVDARALIIHGSTAEKILEKADDLGAGEAQGLFRRNLSFFWGHPHRRCPPIQAPGRGVM